MINLHLHTAFSLLDSISMPDTVAERVAELGQEAVAITEHGNIYSHIKHYKACKEQGIKAIIGSEMYITEDLSKKDSDSRYYHLVVLAKNNTGLTNLIDMINLSTKEENFYYKPRIDFNILKEHSEGLIILSACLGSQVMKTIEKYVDADKEAEKLALEWKEMQTQELTKTYTAKQKGLDIDSSGYKDNLTQYNEDTQYINSKYEDLIEENIDKLKAKYWNKARGIALQYKEVFGEDYYLEYQSHTDEQQQVQNRLLVDLAKELDIPYVVTADAHYIKESDQDAHSMWVKVGTAREAGETYNDCYIQDDEDVYRICKSTTQEENSIAIENTHKIAEKCNVEIKLSAPIMPHIPIPKEFNSEFEYIANLCAIGWKNKELDKLPSEQREVYKTRLKYELSALNDMGFVGYMLLVRDIVGQIDEKGVGRGSSAGSLVAYLLDITGVDPIQYDLFFERFIDVGQLEAIKQGTIDPMDIKVPDVDTDISQEGRLKAYNYIKDTYGVEHFAMIGSFGYVKAKNAIKDTVRAMELDISLGERLSQLVPDGSSETLEELVDMGTFDEYKDSSKVQEVLKYATQFYGLPRSVGIHPSAVVITNKTMNNYSSVRINKDNNQPVLDLDQYDAEDIGLVKVDLLGLRTIDLYYEVLRELEEQGIKFNEDKIDYNRDDVYAMFKTGNTELLFQFESTGMQDALATIQPNSINELAMANALYRPGSMRYIDVYGKRLRGEEEVTYIHPDLEEILKPTLGILVFQEQLISIGRLANMKNADDIRVATAKKKIDMMQRVKPELFSGLKARGWTENQLNSLWNTIIEFSLYSFNKSHAVAYSILAYKSAVLKTDFPHIYMTAVINSYEGKFENIAHSIKVAKDMGIDVIIPKWNEIKGRTWTDNENIYIGFNSIKNLNQDKGDALNQSAIKIEYDNFFDVVRQIQEKTKELGHKIGDSDIAQMIELNMFSEFGSISHVRELCKLYSYRGRKSIQKKQIHKTPFTEEYIRQYSGGETDKSFTKVDFNSLIDDFEIKTTPNPFDKLIAESTYIGVPLSIIPNLKSNMTGILLDIIRTSYNNIIYKFYSLKTGLTLELKNKNKNPNEFEKGDLVEITNFRKDKKWKVYEDENGKKVFDRLDTNEFLCYSMIKLNKERISDYLR